MQDNTMIELLKQHSTQQRFYGKFYPKIAFLFSHNARDFIVDEIPLYPFNNIGEHRILRVRKKNINTLECVKLIAKTLNIRDKDIGYAGLKDKNALAYQYISVPNKAFLQNECKLHEIPQIKIIESYLHTNKIKIGHLQGNRFIIRLKKVTQQSFERIQEEAFLAQKYGFPNFFGYQRFGNFGDNYIQALQIKRLPNKQNPIEQLITSSLQSAYFNLWLEERLKISNIIQSFSPEDSIKALENNYKLTISKEMASILHKSSLSLTPLIGDVCMHYPHGKLFYFGDMRNLAEQNLMQDIARLRNGDISITGLLSGINCYKENADENTKKYHIKLAKKDSLNIEKKFCHEIMAYGARRYAWVYPSKLELNYHKEQAHLEISFILPSGAYATTFLSYIKNGDVRDFD